jgi:DNA mismatch repair protein PMS2
MVAFATDVNPNTRGNIANVYGAKALLNLIPLNLTFKVDLSNWPSAIGSARDLNR